MNPSNKTPGIQNHRPSQIGQCNLFKFECPQQWDSMTATQNPDIRFCEQCKEAVYFCHTEEELRNRGQHGQCAAIAIPVPTTQETSISDEPRRMIRGGMPAGNGPLGDIAPLQLKIPPSSERSPSNSLVYIFLGVVLLLVALKSCHG